MESSIPGKQASLQQSLHWLHKGLNGRVTLNDKVEASLPNPCYCIATPAAQRLMNQPHLLPSAIWGWL